jgi:hypothetical protein
MQQVGTLALLVVGQTDELHRIRIVAVEIEHGAQLSQLAASTSPLAAGLGQCGTEVALVVVAASHGAAEHHDRREQMCTSHGLIHPFPRLRALRANGVSQWFETS